MYQFIKEYTEEHKEDWIKIRRDFHQFPETGWMEMRTTSLIAVRLKELGYEVLCGEAVCKRDSRMGVPSPELLEEHYQWAAEHGAAPEFLPASKGGQTGVIGILRNGKGPTVALRFDMDALGVYESTSLSHKPASDGFHSTLPGIMHACGHDGHMTIGLGTAEILSRIKDKLHGTVKLIFQPAEEGVRGAKSVVDHGHLDDVDFLLGSHILPSDDEAFYVAPGVEGTLATTKLDACYSGKASHAAFRPQEGNNALLAAAAAVLNLQAIPRHSDGSSRINVGTLHAGTGRNVICDRAKMEIEVRGETTEINHYMEDYSKNILEAAAAMHHCSVKIEVMGSAGEVKCSSDFVKQIGSICEDMLHLPVRKAKKFGASEDFSYMTERVLQHGGKTCFTGIHMPCTEALHNARFDFDENGLILGIQYYAGVVYQLLACK